MLGATRAYEGVYGVTVATIRRARSRFTTLSGLMPLTSKHTRPAERLVARGVCKVTCGTREAFLEPAIQRVCPRGDARSADLAVE